MSGIKIFDVFSLAFHFNGKAKRLQNLNAFMSSLNDVS